jgi:hypothetical protein
MTEEERLLKERNELEILFPERKVELAPNIFVTLRPLSIEDIPRVMTAFVSLISRIRAGTTPEMIAIHAMADVLAVLPLCVDREISKIPATKFSEVIKVFLEQNITEEVVKNWTALLGEMRAAVEQGKEEFQKAAGTA